MHPLAWDHPRVTRNLGLVHFLARQIHRGPVARFVDLDELVSVGWLALALAAERFDSDRGSRFSSYAAISIRRAMLEAVALAQHGVNRIRLLRYSRAGVPVPRLRCMPDDTCAPARASLTRLELTELSGRLDRLVSRLRPQQQLVLRRHHLEERTLADIGQELGVTKQRVGQIAKESMAELCRVAATLPKEAVAGS